MWKSVAYGNGKYVVVPNNDSYFATSTDGTTWSESTILAGLWNKIIYDQGLFVVVGQGTVVLTSSDGSTWTQRSVTNANWISVDFNKPTTGTLPTPTPTLTSTPTPSSTS